MLQLWASRERKQGKLGVGVGLVWFGGEERAGTSIIRDSLIPKLQPGRVERGLSRDEASSVESGSRLPDSDSSELCWPNRTRRSTRRRRPFCQIFLWLEPNSATGSIRILSRSTRLNSTNFRLCYPSFPFNSSSSSGSSQRGELWLTFGLRSI